MLPHHSSGWSPNHHSRSVARYTHISKTKTPSHWYGISPLIITKMPLPVPASVYGLVLLLAALTTGFVKLEQVKETGTYLTGIFPLLFVPAAAGIMELWAEMGQLLLPILIAILPVTVLVMAAAGRTTQALTARNKKEEADHD